MHVTAQVGLAGASGSGKTTFCKKLQSLLPSITVLSMDMYNDSSKLVDGNFDGRRASDTCGDTCGDCNIPCGARIIFVVVIIHTCRPRVYTSPPLDPRLTDYELLLQNLHDLRAGRAIQAPIYDFKHSKRVGYRQVDVPESRIVVVEGIYALSPQLRYALTGRFDVVNGGHVVLVWTGVAQACTMHMRV